jgi:hypothetical protein
MVQYSSGVSGNGANNVKIPSSLGGLSIAACFLSAGISFGVALFLIPRQVRIWLPQSWMTTISTSMTYKKLFVLVIMVLDDCIMNVILLCLFCCVGSASYGAATAV